MCDKFSHPHSLIKAFIYHSGESRDSHDVFMPQLRKSGEHIGFGLSVRPSVDGKRGGLVVNDSDSGSRGRGFEPHSGQPFCVLEQGTFTPQKVLVIPRKRWLRPNMTEKIVYRDVKNQSTNQPTNQPTNRPSVCPFKII